MTVMEKLMNAVLKRQQFVVDFEKRNLIINNQLIVKNGKPKDGMALYDLAVETQVNSFASVKDYLHSCFEEYYCSYPEKRKSKHAIFIAKRKEDMSDLELIVAKDRRAARAQLEGMFLCFLINGKLKYEGPDDSFFWEINGDNRFVALRKWF